MEGIWQKTTVLGYSLLFSQYESLINFYQFDQDPWQQEKQGHSLEAEFEEEAEFFKTLGDGSYCKGIFKSISMQPYGPQGSFFLCYPLTDLYVWTRVYSTLNLFSGFWMWDVGLH